MFFKQLIAALSMALALGHAQAADAPDALIERVSTEVIDTVKADKAIQAGDVDKVIALVDAKVMPHVELPAHDRVGGRPLLAPGHTRATEAPAGRVQDPAGAHLCRRADAGAGPDRAIEADARRRGRHRCRRAHRDQGQGRSRSSSTTGSRRTAAAGRSTTSTCWASGWCSSTATAFATEIGGSGIDGLITKLAERNKAAAKVEARDCPARDVDAGAGQCGRGVDPGSSLRRAAPRRVHWPLMLRAAQFRHIRPGGTARGAPARRRRRAAARACTAHRRRWSSCSGLYGVQELLGFAPAAASDHSALA